MIRLLIIAFAAQFFVSSCSSAQQEAKTTSESNTTTQQNKSSIDFENAVFVDVRTPGEFERGSFENAINIPLNELSSRVNELDKEDQIVVFCKSGARASNALQILKNKGFSNVINGVNTSNLRSLKNQ